MEPKLRFKHCVSQGLAPQWDDLIRYFSIVLPFGKYEGAQLHKISLKYLDETISIMPQTWLVRMIRNFIDLAMDILMDLDDSRNRRITAVPNISVSEWMDEVCKKSEAATNGSQPPASLP